MSSSRWVAASATFFIAVAHATSDPSDPAMLKLASRSGCLTCHHVEAAPQDPKGSLPVGPAWEDVALRYRGKPQAADQLTRIVLAGSSPYASHWKGQANGLAMPPNAVAIDEANAHKLVVWILALDPQRPASAAGR
jgi:cytochrome c